MKEEELLAASEDSGFGKRKSGMCEGFCQLLLEFPIETENGVREQALSVFWQFFGEVKQSCQKDLDFYGEAEFTCRPYSAPSPSDS